MKHGNTHYLELSRKIFDERHSQLSLNAKWLFVVLNELEQRYTGDKEDFFFRSNDDLAKDSGMSLPTMKRAKAELVKTDLIQYWHMHFRNTETGKLSEKKVSAYRILV